MAKQHRNEEIERDEVAESFQETIDWLRRNQWRLVIAIIIVGVGFAAYNVMQSRARQTAVVTNDYLSQAIGGFRQLDMISDATQRDELINQILTATDTLNEGYADTPLGRRAIHLRGATLLTVDRFAEAREAFEAYGAAAVDAHESAAAELGLACAFENEAFLAEDGASALLDSALEHYREAVRVAAPSSWQADYARLGEARMLEATGHIDGAIGLYEEIVAERAPLTPLAPATQPDPDDFVSMVLHRDLSFRDERVGIATLARRELDRLAVPDMLTAPVEELSLLAIAPTVPAGDTAE